MNFHALALTLHVVAAILLGQVVATALIAEVALLMVFKPW